MLCLGSIKSLQSPMRKLTALGTAQHTKVHSWLRYHSAIQASILLDFRRNWKFIIPAIRFGLRFVVLDDLGPLQICICLLCSSNFVGANSTTSSNHASKTIHYFEVSQHKRFYSMELFSRSQWWLEYLPKWWAVIFIKLSKLKEFYDRQLSKLFDNFADPSLRHILLKSSMFIA